MHMSDILLDVCGFSTLRLKSPVITAITDLSVKS